MHLIVIATASGTTSKLGAHQTVHLPAAQVVYGNVASHSSSISALFLVRGSCLTGIARSLHVIHCPILHQHNMISEGGTGWVLPDCRSDSWAQRFS